MNKINGLVLSALTAAFLVGCGGGGGSSSSGTTSGTTSENVVTAERGAIFDAKVTDASGQLAVQLDKTKNEYTFESKITFPVTVIGGFIDMDGDITTKDDVINFEGETLTSYSNNITPITNYLGDPELTTEYETKLQTLRTVLGNTEITAEELKSLPSKLAKTNIFALTNTIYLATKQNVSDFTSIFNTLNSSITSSDPKAIAKELETRVMLTELGKTKIPEAEVTNRIADMGTVSEKLKVSDLTRFVSYETGENWYDDNTVSGNTITFKPYSKNVINNNYEWTLDSQNDSVTITKSATNPYQFSYVDPITKEEGTFTILLTKKVDGYDTLYKTVAQIVVTKAEELDPDGYFRWYYPATMQDGVDENNNPKYIDMTQVSQLQKRFEKSSQHMGQYLGMTRADGKVIDYNEKVIGNWEITTEHLICKMIDGKVIYYRLTLVDGKYYIEQQELNGVGYIDSETIYTGSDSELDNLITKIKVAAPIFTSATSFSVDENQTTAFTAVATSDAKIIYSLSSDNNFDESYFNIDSSTGVVTFKKAPDFETKSSYSIYVVAKNKLNGLAIGQYVNITIKDVVNETSTPTTPEFNLTNEMISGKQITFTDNLDTVVANFFSNGTYFEEFTNVEANDNTGECNGTWSIDNGKLVINSKCSDSQSSETTSVTLNAAPAEGVEGKAVEELNNRTTDVKIKSVTTVPTDWLLISNTIISISDTKFEFGPYGHYLERASDNSYSCTGKWSYGTGKEVNVGCGSETGKSIVFPSYTPNVGDTITMKFDSVPETATITEISPF